MTEIVSDGQEPVTPVSGSPPAGESAAGNGAAPPSSAPADWRLDLPEDIRYDTNWDKFKGKEVKEILPAVAKAYINTLQLVGREKIPMPKSEAEWGLTWDKLGRPETPDGYKFERPQMPEGVTYDEEGEKAFRAIAHGKGLNQAQAQGMLNDLIKLRLEQQQSMASAWDTQRSEHLATLKKELGQAYEPFTKSAGQVVEQYGGEAAKAVLNAAGLGDHPAIVSMMGKIAREFMGVGKLKNAELTQALTPGEWDARIAEFRAKAGTALFDARNPDNPRLARELADLYAKRAGAAA